MTNKSILGAAVAALLVSGSSAFAAGRLVVTEWNYQGGGGEFIEITNIATADPSGANDINLAGYKYDDDSASYAAGLSLGTGTLKPGESLIITESNAAIFSLEWDLANKVSYPIIVLGNNTINIGRADTINIFDASQNIVASLQYNDQTIGGPRTQGVSGVCDEADWTEFANSSYWYFSSADSIHWTSLSGGVGSPGVSK